MDYCNPDSLLAYRLGRLALYGKLQVGKLKNKKLVMTPVWFLL